MTTTSDDDDAVREAATRAELDALRRRAYSAEADIASDPIALARLEQLEDLIRRPSSPDPAAEAPQEAQPVPVPRPTRAPDRRAKRRGWHLALIATTAGAAFVLGATAWAEVESPTAAETGTPLAAIAADALAFANDPDASVLYTLRLDGAFGVYADPYPSDVPAVPIEGPRWASGLGEYYGYDLFLLGSMSLEAATDDDAAKAEEQLCLVLANGSTVLSRCVPRAGWEQGALLLAVDFTAIAPDERPAGMSADQSLGFWWTDDDSIRVLLGRVG